MLDHITNWYLNLANDLLFIRRFEKQIRARIDFLTSNKKVWMGLYMILKTANTRGFISFLCKIVKLLNMNFSIIFSLTLSTLPLVSSERCKNNVKYIFTSVWFHHQNAKKSSQNSQQPKAILLHQYQACFYLF